MSVNENEDEDVDTGEVCDENGSLLGRGRGDEWFDVSVDWISKSN